MKKITLILGGIRSGKSHFAEQKAEFYSENPFYIATAINFDGDMNERIQLHRERRGNRYRLLEEPEDLTVPLSEIRDCTVLVDCMTLNLSNRLLKKEDDLNLGALIKTDEAYLGRVLDIIDRNRLNVIFVANEVGFAPVAVNKLARYFQDLQGRWNRILAQAADEVYLVRAGIPAVLKKTKKFPFKISAPSYLLPTGYVENATYLIDYVDDIQLLLFDSREDDPLFQANTLMTLQYLAREQGITYSAHMPVNPRLYDNFEGRLNTAVTAIRKLFPMNISTYTFHYDLPRGTLWEELSENEKEDMAEIYIRFFKLLREEYPEIDISLENTKTPLCALDPVVKACGLSYCIDIGHLLEQGWDLSEIEPRLENTSVVHFHGWEETDGKKQDHRAIRYDRDLFKLLESFPGILTIENYHKQLFHKSLEVLADYF